MRIKPEKHKLRSRQSISQMRGNDSTQRETTDNRIFICHPFQNRQIVLYIGTVQQDDLPRLAGHAQCIEKSVKDKPGTQCAWQQYPGSYND